MCPLELIPTHDRFFKTMMEKPNINREFLIANLPSNILDLVGLDTILYASIDHLWHGWNLKY